MDGALPLYGLPLAKGHTARHQLLDSSLIQELWKWLLRARFNLLSFRAGATINRVKEPVHPS
jgi:hypothetical protein